jgi:uncharacterized protein
MESSTAIWAVSDGRAGLAAQVLGLAEAVARLSSRPVEPKTADFRRVWRILPPPLLAGPTLGLPRSGLKENADPIAPPWPRLFIGCGKAGIALSLYLKRAGAQAFRVQTQDPRIASSNFDLVVPPFHDEIAGPNVFPIVGSPNRITSEKLAEVGAQFAARYEALARPRVGVLIGGDTKRRAVSPADMDALAGRLSALAKSGYGLMVTVSRRTSDGNQRLLRERLAGAADVWKGDGANPYFGILALADFLLVTEDSTNMATEAATAGKPLYILPLAGAGVKQQRLHADLYARGMARPFDGKLEAFSYAPLRETDRAAAEIVRRAGL